jgi:hypothetical protein
LAGLVLALAAAALGWGFIQAKHPHYEVGEEFHIVAMGGPESQVRKLMAEQARVDRRNATINLAVVGGLLAAALALATPGCCAGWLRMIVALPWGALVGAATGLAGIQIYLRLVPPEIQAQPTVTDAVKVQAILFALLGAGIGLMIGTFLRSVKGFIVGVAATALAGLLGGIAYPILATVLMPSHSSEGLMPSSSAMRLLWLGVPCAFMGFLVPLITSQESPPAADQRADTAANPTVAASPVSEDTAAN